MLRHVVVIELALIVHGLLVVPRRDRDNDVADVSRRCKPLHHATIEGAAVPEETHDENAWIVCPECGYKCARAFTRARAQYTSSVLSRTDARTSTTALAAANPQCETRLLKTMASTGKD